MEDIVPVCRYLKLLEALSHLLKKASIRQVSFHLDLSSFYSSLSARLAEVCNISNIAAAAKDAGIRDLPVLDELTDLTPAEVRALLKMDGDCDSFVGFQETTDAWIRAFRYHDAMK